MTTATQCLKYKKFENKANKSQLDANDYGSTSSTPYITYSCFQNNNKPTINTNQAKKLTNINLK